MTARYEPANASLGGDTRCCNYHSEYEGGLHALVPDFRIRVRRWAGRDDFVLVEWTASATWGGEFVEWGGTDRFTLRGDRAIEGVAYFDTQPLWARIDPNLQAPMQLEEAIAQARATV